MIATERHESAITTPTVTGKNCYSHAFCLSGMLSEERPLSPSEARQLLNRCTETNRPEIGGFVHLFNGEKEHIAYITGLNPITVSDRAGIGGEVREGIPLTDILFEYGGLDIGITYMRPPQGMSENPGV